MSLHKNKKHLFEPEGRHVVLPQWVWAYVKLKADFYCMPESAFLLMIIQREMEKNSANVQRFIEASFFNQVGGIQENIDPFDAEVADILKLSYKFSEALKATEDLKESICGENIAAKCYELKISPQHFKIAERKGIHNKLASEGWVYDSRFKLWRTKYGREVQSKDIGLAEKICQQLNNFKKEK